MKCVGRGKGNDRVGKLNLAGNLSFGAEWISRRDDDTNREKRQVKDRNGFGVGG